MRHVFGDAADQIVIANTKGFTGHAMATGIEDVVAVKALETGCVPPVANFKEIDPELGPLNLSKGGIYPVEYALRLAAGFGSQISMMLLRWMATKDGVHPSQNALGYAYRIVDAEAWKAWLTANRGRSGADLEVVQHTLRVHDARVPMKTTEVVPATLNPRPRQSSQSGSAQPSQRLIPGSLRFRRKSVQSTTRISKLNQSQPRVRSATLPLRQPIRSKERILD